MSDDKVVLHINNDSKNSPKSGSIRNDYRLESCCFNSGTDKRLYILIVQTVISIGVIIFCSVMLSDENISCERGQTFVSLISLIIGYWIKSPVSN